MKRNRSRFWCIGLCLAMVSSALADVPDDADGDGDVDFDDFALLALCQFGPDLPTIPICEELYDADFDADLDMADVAAFQRCFSGANQIALPDCAPHIARLEGECLHIIGTAADSTVVLRLQTGVPSTLLIDVGNDGVPDFSFDRGSFN